MHCSFGLPLWWLGPSGSERPSPSQPFGPRQRQGRPSPSSALVAYRQKSDRSAVGGGVVEEQAGRVADRIGGRIHGGANRAVGSDGGGADEQPRAPARRSRELSASVRSLRRCQGARRGTGVAVHGG
jgi:hypothetical protein